ncbi:MAG TPA: hypothetical protein VGI40_16295 [Pirellulaceae bacterium]
MMWQEFVNQLFQIVRLADIDVQLFQQRFEIFFGALLAMEANDIM